MQITPDTFVTGGTGFLGRWLLASLTRRGRRVAALVRNAEERGPELCAFVDAHGGNAQRLDVLEGDLGTEGLGLEQPLDEVRDVFHLAATFAFGMDPEQARAVNVDGALRVARWAAARPRLRRLVHLGGYRAAHLPAWLESAPLPLSDAPRARLYRDLGAYEASKAEGHLSVRAFAKTHSVPLTMVNPSTVVGDSRTGETTQLTGVGETVRDLFAGKLPALAGTRHTNVPLVSVDHVAEVLATVPENERTIGQELCVLDGDTPRLPELMHRIGAQLGVEAPSRIVPTGVVRLLPRALSGVEREALSFLTEDEYDTSTADAHARHAGLTKPVFDDMLERWATYLVASRFGEVASPELARFMDVAGSRTYCVGDPQRADTVFLHGIPWDGESWRTVADRVGGSSARPDLAGLGRSSASAGTRAEWLSELLAGRERPVTLVGHSLGCGLAVRFAHAFPERVAGLVLTSPFFLQSRPPWYLRIAPLGSRLLSLGGPAMLQKQLLGAQDEVSPAVASAHAQLHRAGVAKRTAQALAQAARVDERAELCELLRALRVPVLIVHGENDALVTPPGAGEVVEIADAGHNPHVSHAHETAAAISAWRTESVPTHVPKVSRHTSATPVPKGAGRVRHALRTFEPRHAGCNVPRA